MLYFCLLSVSFIFSISILFGIWLPCQPPCPPPPSPPLTSWYGSCIAKNDQVLYGTACCHFLLDKPINIFKKRNCVSLSSFWGPLYFTIEGTKPLAPRGKRMTESQREKGFRFFWGISTCYWSILWSLFQFAIFKPLEGGHARLTPRLLCSPMCFSQFENLGIVFEDDHHEK